MNTQSRGGKIARPPFAVREAGELGDEVEALIEKLEGEGVAPGAVARVGGGVEEEDERKREPLCGVALVGKALGQAAVKVSQGRWR